MESVTNEVEGDNHVRTVSVSGLTNEEQAGGNESQSEGV